MTVQHLILDVPQPVIEHLKQRAARSHRTVEIEAVEALMASVDEDATLSADIAAELEIMTTMSNEALWQAAGAALPAEDVARLEELHWLQQSRPLDTTEHAEEQALLHAYEVAMLRRAQAMALLKERGHDISPLIQIG